MVRGRTRMHAKVVDLSLLLNLKASGERCVVWCV